MNNPYQSPNSELVDAAEINTELAGRWARLGAALIDSIIGMLLAMPFWIYTGFWEKLQAGEEPSILLVIAAGAYGLFATILVHGYFLHANGQTIGKKLLGIRIANMQGLHPGLNKIIFMRMLPVTIASLVPMIGQFLVMIDVLFIFRKNKRCVHDQIAGTQVLKA